MDPRAKPLEMVTRVKSKKYKLTITATHEIRMKIPEVATPEQTIRYIERCASFARLLAPEGIVRTLRAYSRTSGAQQLTFRAGGRKKEIVCQVSIETGDIIWKSLK